MVSRLMTERWVACWMSTTGVAPETVTVSCSEPTASWALIGTLTPATTSTPSRRTVLNPWSEKVTV